MREMRHSMIKRLVKTLAVAFSASVLAVFAQDAEIAKVKGRGVGVGKTETLKDAYRDAVERAVGMYVDAEQMMKNEELVKDQILTQSNAYIAKYDIVKENAKPNGLVEIQILAEVRKTALAKKISDVMPSKTFKLNSSTTQNLHARLVTDEKSRQDGAALIRNALEGVDPVRQLLKASLVSPEPEFVNNRSGGGRRNNGDYITLRYTFKFEIDRNRYMNEFLPLIQKTLEQISTVEPKTVRMTGSSYGKYTTFKGYVGERSVSTASRGPGDTGGSFRAVLLFTEWDARFTAAKARLYGLSESAGKAMSSWQYRLVEGTDWNRGRRCLTYNVIIKSKDGTEICVAPLLMYYFNLLPVAPAAWGNMDTAIIAPLVGIKESAHFELVDCKIPKDELPNIDSITIELAE